MFPEAGDCCSGGHGGRGSDTSLGHEPPNGILSGSAIFAGLTVVTDTQTRRCADRPRRSVRSNRPHLILRTAMPPSNKIPKTTIADICPLVGVRG